MELFQLSLNLAPEAEMDHVKSIILTEFEEFSKQELLNSSSRSAVEWYGLASDTSIVWCIHALDKGYKKC